MERRGLERRGFEGKGVMSLSEDTILKEYKNVDEVLKWLTKITRFVAM